jgi:hypothetical protein
MLYCEQSPSKSVEKLNESKYKVVVLGAHPWQNLASERVGAINIFLSFRETSPEPHNLSVYTLLLLE